MPDASILSLLALLVGIAILLVLLLRRAPTDSTIALLQGAQERQGERLAALPGEIALRSSEVAEKLSAAILDQTKALNAALREQAEATARHRALQAEAEAALKRDMEAGLGALKLTVEALRTVLAEAETRAQQAMAVEAEKTRAQVEAKLTEMRESNDKRLADIQKSVNEQLQSAVEKQMAESFNRVIDQFAAVQKAMGDVQAVTAQIGDLKRLFSNVKTRGGWGEAQVKALLDDILPEGGYVQNLRTREDTTESVEFGVVMPNPGGAKLYLPIDAKFPAEDYDRLLLAAESGDAEGERTARRALGERVRRQAGDIAQKYINPPITVEFAVLYLPTDSLFAEVARIPGLLEEIGRVQRVLVLGPSLLPAMLRTIQLGHVSLALSENAQSVRELLGATKAEMQKMDEVLKKLGKQAGTFGRTIESALTRTRAIGRKLRGVDAVNFERSEQVLEIEAESTEGEEEEA
jgi:DNA recombination protein RmuC